MRDLSKLSDDELAATLILLGEQAQEITDATSLVRVEQQRRAAPPEQSASDLGDYGTAALDSAVKGAPARAKVEAKLKEEAEAAAAAETADG